jgi:predicted GIY-YIG superfamily endonuclease
LSDETIYIYALTCPDTGDVMYVGKTQDLTQRVRGHLCDKEKTNPKAQWIKSLLEQDKLPGLAILEEVPLSNWMEAEKSWIRHYRSINENLLNVMDGGGYNRATPKEYFSMTIRFSEELMNWLRDEADKNRRSVNGQVEFMLLQIKMKENDITGNPQMCYGGKHRFISNSPDTAEVCNCGQFVYGEVAK